MIHPHLIPPNLARCLDPQEQAKLNEGQERALGKAEREEQKLFNTFLEHQKALERLDYVTPQAHKPSTIAAGHPDYTIFLMTGEMLLIEMKVPGGKLSKNQIDKIAFLEKLGHPVSLVWGHHQAINLVLLRLSVILTNKKNDHPSDTNH